MDDAHEDLHALVKSVTSSSLATYGSEIPTFVTPHPAFLVFGLSSSDPSYLHEAINNPFLYPDMDWLFKPLNPDEEEPLHDPQPLQPTPILPISSSTTTTTTILSSSSDYSIHARKASAAISRKRSNISNHKKTALNLQEHFHLAKIRSLNHQQTWTVHGVDGKSDIHDPWPWIMHGQKTLKSSTYPRRYYRCAIKSCLAVKHRQQTSEDPERMFTVKYTGTHNHPPPSILNPLTSSHYKPVVAKNSKKGKSIVDNNNNVISTTSKSNAGGYKNAAVLALAAPCSAGVRSFSNSSNSSMTSNGRDGGGVVMNMVISTEVDLDVFGDNEEKFGFLDDEFFEGIEDELRKKFFSD